MITVITNNVPRPIVEAYELTDQERKEFDYYDWDKVERGEEWPTFFRYRGETYDLGEFMYTGNMPVDNPLHKWAGYQSDSYFSGILVRYTDDMEQVIVGRFYS